MSVLRVVLADDQAMVRAGLDLVLRAEPDVRVVAACANGDEVLAAVAGQPDDEPVDVVLMDARMPVRDGIAATAELRRRPGSPPVLVLTTFDDDEVLWGALEAGAHGFVLKDSPPESLAQALRVVAAGGMWFDPRVTTRVHEVLRGRHSRTPAQRAAVLDELTPREEQVLRLLAAGRSNAEIARALRVGERTVKSHVSAVLAKLGVRDRVAAVVRAHELGVDA